LEPDPGQKPRAPTALSRLPEREASNQIFPLPGKLRTHTAVFSVAGSCSPTNTRNRSQRVAGLIC